MVDLNERALELYTREELNELITANEKILTYARGELRWEVSTETQEFRAILQLMDERGL